MSARALKPTPQALRSFGVTLGVLFLVFGAGVPLLVSRSFPWWPWVVAALLWAMALMVPRSLGPVFRGWMKLGGVLGWVNTRVLLGLFYFLAITPVALVLKVLGKDAMRRRMDPSATTYRVPSVPRPPHHMEAPY
jgi:hypothetical protein